MNPDLVNLNQIVANVFNGKTPTGNQWSLGYNEGYLVYSGTIKTYGNW
jgi:basic membrane lipoprotein Med (substrate-binding protein (PBP1-ABC) superfamily)